MESILFCLCFVFVAFQHHIGLEWRNIFINWFTPLPLVYYLLALSQHSIYSSVHGHLLILIKVDLKSGFNYYTNSGVHDLVQ